MFKISECFKFCMFMLQSGGCNLFIFEVKCTYSEMYSRIQLPNYNYECVNDPCNEHKNLPYRTFPSFQRVLSRPLTGTILHRQPLIWFLLPEFCLFYFFNRHRAILIFSCVSFFLRQFLCGVLFQENFPIHLRC